MEIVGIAVHCLGLFMGFLAMCIGGVKVWWTVMYLLGFLAGIAALLLKVMSLLISKGSMSSMQDKQSLVRIGNIIVSLISGFFFGLSLIGSIMFTADYAKFTRDLKTMGFTQSAFLSYDEWKVYFILVASLVDTGAVIAGAIIAIIAKPQQPTVTTTQQPA